MEKYPKYRSDLNRPELVLPGHKPAYHLNQIVSFQLENGTIAEYSLERALELGMLARGLVKRNVMSVGGYIRLRKEGKLK